MPGRDRQEPGQPRPPVELLADLSGDSGRSTTVASPAPPWRRWWPTPNSCAPHVPKGNARQPHATHGKRRASVFNSELTNDPHNIILVLVLLFGGRWLLRPQNLGCAGPWRRRRSDPDRPRRAVADGPTLDVVPPATGDTHLRAHAVCRGGGAPSARSFNPGAFDMKRHLLLTAAAAVCWSCQPPCWPTPPAAAAMISRSRDRRMARAARVGRRVRRAEVVARDGGAPPTYARRSMPRPLAEVRSRSDPTKADRPVTS